MAIGTAWNYLTGSNNGPGTVSPSAFGGRGHALLKTADKSHTQPTAQGGADALNSAPDNYAHGHDTFDPTQAQHFEGQEDLSRWKTARSSF